MLKRSENKGWATLPSGREQRLAGGPAAAVLQEAGLPSPSWLRPPRRHYEEEGAPGPRVAAQLPVPPLAGDSRSTLSRHPVLVCFGTLPWAAETHTERTRSRGRVPVSPDHELEKQVRAGDGAGSVADPSPERRDDGCSPPHT